MVLAMPSIAMLASSAKHRASHGPMNRRLGTAGGFRGNRWFNECSWSGMMTNDSGLKRYDKTILQKLRVNSFQLIMPGHSQACSRY